MPREPFDASVIQSAGDDRATSTRASAFRNHRIYRYLDVPPAEWMAWEDAESARSDCSAHTRNAHKCWRLVNRARAKPQQAAPR